MAELVHFDLMVPEKVLISDDVESIVIPGINGDFGVLAGHAPFVSVVAPGTLFIFKDGKITDRIFIEGGIAEVTLQGCVVLADRAVPLAELNLAKIDAEIQSAKEALGFKGEESKAAIEQVLAIAEAKRAALESSAYS